MIRCPTCKTPLRLLPGEKFFVHDGDKGKHCPIFSIPNLPDVVAKLTEPLQGTDTPSPILPTAA
jgi:hypothetical protein